MELQAYHAYLAGTPLPTAPQFDAFAQHVANAHSWYKHLDLVHGAEVVVFLDPRAGGGFDEHQPRLHHAWKTRAEYLERFGHLAYMWRHGDCLDAPFATDYALNATVEQTGPDTFTLVNRRETPTLALPHEIMEQCNFRMYPFVCNTKALRHRFEEELHAMGRGAIDHPCKDLLIAALRACEATDYSAASLRKRFADHRDFDRERHRLYKRGIIEILRETYGSEPALYQQALDRRGLSDECATGTLSDWENDYLRVDRAAQMALGKLSAHEADKIHRALGRLREHLVAAGLSAA